MIALSLVASATLLFSCSKTSVATEYDYETLMTESSENRTITMMENGKRSYTFSSPLMEGYSLATNPYQEFRRGIKMTTYTDSLSLVDATITANYAIYYERQKLWEAKGNVVIIKNNRKEGDTIVTGLTEIYTQQLFWNASTKKIYSNVDTKVLQPDGWHFGVGFDADDDLKNIHFRKYSSEMEFDMSQPTPEEKAETEAKKETKKREEEENKKKKESKKSSNTSRAKNISSDSRFTPTTPQSNSRNRANTVGDKNTKNFSPTTTTSTKVNTESKSMGNATLRPGGGMERPKMESSLESQSLSTNSEFNPNFKR